MSYDLTPYTLTVNGNYYDVKQEQILPGAVSPESFIFLNLRFSALGNSAQGDKSAIEIDADKKRITLSKKLLDCPELEAISSYTNAVAKRLTQRAFSVSKAFKNGIYAIPLTMLEDIDADLTSCFASWKILVREFVSVYETARFNASCSKEKGGLGSQYRDSDYPLVSEVESHFKFRWNYLSFGVPSTLPPEMRQRELEALRSSLSDSLEECRLVLRSTFVALIDRATDRLRSDPDGKPLRFTSSLQDQFKDFLDYFADRNSLAQDESLPILVAKARNIFSLCPDLAILKTDLSLRETIQKQFASLKDEIDNAELISRPKRAITISPSPLS